MAVKPQGYIYGEANILPIMSATGLKVNYVTPEDKLAISGSTQIRFRGVEYDGSAMIGGVVIIDGPFDNPAGDIEYYADFADTGETTGWHTAILQPFAVATQIQAAGYVTSSAYPNGGLLYDGWVSFEKSFGFNSEVTDVSLYGIDRDGGLSNTTAPQTHSIYDGVYLPDVAAFNGFDLYGVAKCGTGSELNLFYPQSVVEGLAFTQVKTDDEKRIMPEVSIDYAIGGDLFYHPRIVIKSVTKPTQTFHINNATIHSAAQVLMPDGSVRLIVCSTTDRRFDVYAASNAGAEMIFNDLWDETYHGAQLGYLLDGTLVSYAWKISYFAGDEAHAAGIRYSLYFKRSLDDGHAWEIAIKAADDVTSIGGLPILTQNITTGRLKIGSVHSDDMGLHWE